MEAEYDLMLSQQLILQPRFEMGLAVQDVPEYDVGSGITDIELGARLRYEIRRKFAPYIGIAWGRKIGETADLLKAKNQDVESVAFVAGLKLWL